MRKLIKRGGIKIAENVFNNKSLNRNEYGLDRVITVEKIITAIAETRKELLSKSNDDNYYKGAFDAIEMIKHKLGKDVVLLDINK